MTMMNGFDVRDVDIMDEEYFGPPPRFLVENRAADDFAPFDRAPRRTDEFPALTRIKDLLGVR